MDEDDFTRHHQWWKPLAWIVGGRVLGEYDARYHPVRKRILSILITAAIIAIVIYLVIAHNTDPRNQPLPVPPNNGT